MCLQGPVAVDREFCPVAADREFCPVAVDREFVTVAVDRELWLWIGSLWRRIGSFCTQRVNRSRTQLQTELNVPDQIKNTEFTKSSELKHSELNT